MRAVCAKQGRSQCRQPLEQASKELSLIKIYLWTTWKKPQLDLWVMALERGSEHGKREEKREQ